MKHTIGDNQTGNCTTADALMLDGKVITKQKVVELVQRNAELVAQVSRMQTFIRLAAEKWKDCQELGPTFLNLLRVANQQPEDALHKIQAEAGEIGYYNGFKDALVIEPPLPPPTGTSATVDIFAYRVEQASRYAANQYANRIKAGEV